MGYKALFGSILDHWVGTHFFIQLKLSTRGNSVEHYSKRHQWCIYTSFTHHSTEFVPDSCSDWAYLNLPKGRSIAVLVTHSLGTEKATALFSA